MLGTVFAERSAVVRRLTPGDRLILVPDPPDTDEPAVWVHATGGDVVGHLPFLDRLASLLVSADEDARAILFRNAGLVKLVPRDGASGYAVAWILVPDLA